MSPVRSFLYILIAGILAAGGCGLSYWGFSKINQMRELERIPRSSVVALLEGEINLEGKAVMDNWGVLKAPKSGKKCMYYRYLIEEERTDSDGDSSWHTIHDETKFSPFYLKDKTGKVTVVPHEDVEFSINVDFEKEIGDRRYREWRIDEGDKLFVFGYAEKKKESERKSSDTSIESGYQVGFEKSGYYTPIISEEGELGERKGMATFSVFLSWFAQVAFSFVVFFLLRSFGVHRVLIYLLCVAGVSMGSLVFFGVQMMVGDLTAAKEMLGNRSENTKQAIQETLQIAGATWDGQWESLNLSGEEGDGRERKEFSGLSEFEKTRVIQLRDKLKQSIVRSNEIQSRFPEFLIAPLVGLKKVPEIATPGSQMGGGEQEKQELLSKSATLSFYWAFPVAWVALIVSIAMTLYGLRRIKEKRLIENVPTAPIEGTVYGLTEVKGKLKNKPGRDLLKGPLSGASCAYFLYWVEEKRGSGKDEKWVEIERREERMHFCCCEGNEGEEEKNEKSIEVWPQKAEIITKHKISDRKGNRRYREHHLRLDDEVYVLGSAEIDQVNMDRLLICEGENDFPYIISNYSEEEVMQKKGGVGLLALNVGLNFIFLTGLMFFGIFGAFAATDYLLSALIGPLYLIGVVVVMMFNDLVFLRQRVKRAWANIDVSLQKRYDLLPNLNALVEHYFSHEQSVMESLTKIRMGLKEKKSFQPGKEASELVEAEAHVTQQMVALVEAYPEIKAHEMSANLTMSLVQMENEIALMREGYNDAVEMYNTKRVHIPEVFLSQLFGFKEETFFVGDVAIHQAPKVDL